MIGVGECERVFRSDDQWASFTELRYGARSDCPAPLDVLEFAAVDFPTDQVGYVLAAGSLYCTADGGANFAARRRCRHASTAHVP